MPWRIFVTAGVLVDSDCFARDVDGVHHLEANSGFLRPFRLFGGQATCSLGPSMAKAYFSGMVLSSLLRP